MHVTISILPSNYTFTVWYWVAPLSRLHACKFCHSCQLKPFFTGKRYFTANTVNVPVQTSVRWISWITALHRLWERREKTLNNITKYQVSWTSCRRYPWESSESRKDKRGKYPQAIYRLASFSLSCVWLKLKTLASKLILIQPSITEFAFTLWALWLLAFIVRNKYILQPFFPLWEEAQPSMSSPQLEISSDSFYANICQHLAVLTQSHLA